MLMITTFIFNAVANFALGLGVAYFLGAQEFGVYALAVAGGMVLQTLLFEWLRLATNRFFGEKQALDDPDIAATLNLGTGLVTIVLSIAAVVVYFCGGAFGIAAIVAAMAPLVAIASGLTDYRAAVARACFDNRRYALQVIARNLASLVLTLGGAIWFQRADMVLVGLCLSGLSGVLVTSRFAREKAATGAFNRALLQKFARYSGPMIVSTLVFHVNMFMTRSIVALHYGLAETGRYSLALDIGLKLISTIGSALDILLFQLAVRAEAEAGPEAAQRQLSSNLLLVTAILAPLCAGFWLILPSFELFFVGPSYRGAYASYSQALLPGLFAFGLVFYAVTPLFQIARKTSPVMIAAMANIGVATAVLFLLPGNDGQHGADATTAGFIAAAVVMSLLAWKKAPIRVPWPDLVKVAGATLAMVLAMLPLHRLEPSLPTLVATVTLGGGVYVLACIGLDIASCRARLMARIRPVTV